DDSRIAAEQQLINQSDLIISPSETDKLYMQYLYGGHAEKIAVVTPGVNTKIFFEQPTDQAKKHIGADLNHKLLLFVGRIEPLKGIDVLLYSMKILSERTPQLKVCLWIVGGELTLPEENRSDEMKKLNTLHRQLGLTNIVKFVERKAPSELPYYYNGADLVVSPSQYESFGITALEAMACGTPVITTDVTGVSDLLDTSHESLITSANNPLLLAWQIETLLTDTAAYQKASDEVRKKVQDLDWPLVAQRIINAYNYVIKQ
ncbi:MAG: glycosyltransferase family 4 protein, partial [Patescibacteria group bacterium]|nr:glycosyltransferase family 4 protein [Patescibacteria group bacterium]